MNDNKILVPVDFTEAADTALEFASMIAEKSGLGVTLLHIEDEKSGSRSEEGLMGRAEKLAKEKCLSCEFRIRKGSIFTEIAAEAASEAYELMIIGTHGFKGLREKLLGSDILKLVKNIPVPVIVLQKGYKAPAEGIRKIVFPAGTHKAFQLNIKATVYIARLFQAEVLMYAIEKPGQDWSEELKSNMELARREFEANHITCRRVVEKQTTFSMGYSKQILKYAKEIGADMISVMSIPTPEHYYFADSDKELLLINEHLIPVLSTSDRKSI
jgi:nucleotide-binding universal stress UspA family protein